MDLHVEALAYLRYVKQIPLVATEVGRWNADVLGLAEKYSLEVEIKRSISDLRADFKGKRSKHYYYARAQSQYRGSGAPNYMYFLVPQSLADAAMKYLESQAVTAIVNTETSAGAVSRYGLLSVPDDASSQGHEAGRNVKTVRRAKFLHKNAPSASLVQEVTRRLSSELVGLYQHHLSLEAHLLEGLEEARKDVRACAAVMAAFTPEPPEDVFCDDASPSGSGSGLGDARP